MIYSAQPLQPMKYRVCCFRFFVQDEMWQFLAAAYRRIRRAADGRKVRATAVPAGLGSDILSELSDPEVRLFAECWMWMNPPALLPFPSLPFPRIYRYLRTIHASYLPSLPFSSPDLT